jgi:hypothetical protein
MKLENGRMIDVKSTEGINSIVIKVEMNGVMIRNLLVHNDLFNEIMKA